jgi:hypothetical protein
MIWSFTMYQTLYPLAELLTLLAYGMHINCTQECLGFVQWTPDQQTVYFKHLPSSISMAHF